jgi:hypothetical protein
MNDAYRDAPKLAGRGIDCAHEQITITLTQDQAEHALLCARMALAQAQLAALGASDRTHRPPGEYQGAVARRDTFATLVDVLQKQIVER